MTILAAAFTVLAWQLGSGIRYTIRHELARRRAAKFVFPPLRTIAVSDDIPW